MKMKSLYLPALGIISVAIPLLLTAAARADERPTLGSCMAALTIAQRHNNEWQETNFTPDECAVVAGNAIDAGYVMMDPNSTKAEIDHAIRTLNGEPTEKMRGVEEEANEMEAQESRESTLSDAPAIELKPKHKTLTYYPHHEPDWCCLAAPGYMSEGGFFHHYHFNNGYN